jgi:hypothetical protein
VRLPGGQAAHGGEPPPQAPLGLRGGEKGQPRVEALPGGPVEVVAVQVGQQDAVQVGVVQGAELTRLIRPGRTIPIHFDDYRVMKSPLDDYLRHNLPGVRPVSRGETFELPVRVDEEPK